MDKYSLLVITLIFLLTAFHVFSYLKLPGLLVYPLVGLIIGPSCLSLIQDINLIYSLADFGVIFLMFAIGLEFSLSKLLIIKKYVFILGFFQVACTIAIVSSILFIFNNNYLLSIVLSIIVAISSTAILGKYLQDSSELNTDSGQKIIGILLFQDLIVVPVLIFLPYLSGNEIPDTYSLVKNLFLSITIITLILNFGHRPLTYLFKSTFKKKSSELFSVLVLTITLGFSWLTHYFNLSHLLGAFLAGVLISETKFKEGVLKDIKPFKDLLMGVFFLSIGLQVDISFVSNNYIDIILVTTILMFLKFIIMFVIFRIIPFAKNKSNFKASILLCGGGEFGLVIISYLVEGKFFSNYQIDFVIASILLSMVLNSLIIEKFNSLTNLINKLNFNKKSLDLYQNLAKFSEFKDHIIVCGFGRTGKILYENLKKKNFEIVLVEKSNKNINSNIKNNFIHGDASEIINLNSAGISRAKLLVITIQNLFESKSIIMSVRNLNPKIRILAVIKDEIFYDELKNLGATEVISTNLEFDLMLVSQSLLLLNNSLGSVMSYMDRIKSKRYELFKGIDIDDQTKIDFYNEINTKLLSFEVKQNNKMIGKNLKFLTLDKFKVKLISHQKFGKRNTLPEENLIFEQNDLLVFSGMEDDLVIFEKFLEQ